MNEKRKPIASIGLRRKDGDRWQSYSVVAVWPTDYDGLYNVSLDRGSEKRPAMGPIDAIKALAAGASLEVRFDTGQRRAEAKSGGNYDRPDAGADFGGDDLPF